jgi:flagellar basal-body rod protein FlgF
MNNALYVGLSRQLTLKRQMDVIANNIANSDTAGFKVESLQLGQDVQRPQLQPGQGPAEAITFVHDLSLTRDFRQGPLRQTGGPFDLGLQGGGFFEVQTATGARLTRDGRFSLDGQGQMVDSAGNPVLQAGGQPIRVDPTKSSPQIAHDGTVSQDGQVVGKIGVFAVADRGALTGIGGGLYDPGAQAPTVDTGAVVQQGMIENANVDAIQQMTRMIAVSRAYEQVTSMMDATGTASDQSIQRLGRVN